MRMKGSINDNSSSLYHIGNGFFNDNFTKEVQNQLLQSEQFRVLSSICWTVIQDNFEQWVRLFSLMSKSQVLILRLRSLRVQKHQKICQNIAKIQFSQLKSLSFIDIPLFNVEFFSFIDTEKLMQLSLKSNLIVTIKALAKTCFKNLRKLNCEDNMFLQANYISRVNFSKQKEIKFNFCSKGQKLKTEDVKFLSKLQKIKLSDTIQDVNLIQYCEKYYKQEKFEISQVIYQQKAVLTLERKFLQSKKEKRIDSE